MNKHFQHFSSLVLGLALVTFSALAVPADTVPFTLHRGTHILVKGSLGSLEKLDLLIDTGATMTTVDRRIVKKLNLETTSVEAANLLGPGERVEEASLPNLGLGRVEVKGLKALVIDLSRINIGKRIDIIVGLDALRQFDFTIDYRSRTLTFEDIPPLESTAELSAVAPFLTVVLEVKGHPIRMMLDTSAESSLVFQGAAQESLPELGLREVRTAEHWQGANFVKTVQLPQVSLGSGSWKRMPAVLLDTPAPQGLGIDGLLSVSSLEVARLHFDFQGHLMSWEK